MGSTLENTKLAARGLKFAGGAIVAGWTAKAPVATIPTTAATWTLANANAAGGNSYILDRLTILLASGTSALGSGVVICVSKFAAPAMGAGLGVVSKSASNKASAATIAVDQTLTATPIAWMSVGANGNPVSATIGQGQSIAFDGDILIPPGYVLGVAVIGGTGTSPLNLCWFEWSEQPYTLQ